MSQREQVRKILGHDNFKLEAPFWTVEVDKESLTQEQENGLLASGFGIILLPPNPFKDQHSDETETEE